MATYWSTVIEVDPQIAATHDDDQQPQEPTASSSTLSLTESIQEYLTMNGRTYHKYFGDEKNYMPTDHRERDRMDIHHQLILRILDEELHKAPVEDPEAILDVGTGTGAWAIDMADRWPRAKVTGIDLSPIQPKWVPPNCIFVVDDAELEWTDRANTFDFVHFRNVAQGISQWDFVLSEAYRCLKPGGYIELSESGAMAYCDDGTMAANHGTKYFCDLIAKAMTQVNRPPITSGVLPERLRAAGFVDIQAFELKQPYGVWAKEERLKLAGRCLLQQSDTLFHSYGMAAFTRILGMDDDEADQICREGAEAAADPNTHIYSLHYIAYGRKPQPREEGKEPPKERASG